MVGATLRELDVWYNEPGSQVGDRPKLLSKLAILELCGWIEGEFDRLVMVAQTGRLNHVDWVEKQVLNRTSGFTYVDHLRPMLVKLVGEVFVRRVETKMEVDDPGELERLKGILTNLWKLRCSFAHADVVANVAAQQVFNAPSWSIDQHRTLKNLIDRYERAMVTSLAVI